jgi:hypothetical protein
MSLRAAITPGASSGSSTGPTPSSAHAGPYRHFYRPEEGHPHSPYSGIPNDPEGAPSVKLVGEEERIIRVL